MSAGRTIAGLLAIGLVLLPVVAVMNGWIGQERFALRRLRIDGQLNTMEAQAVRAAVTPHARRGFFASDMAAAQQAIAQLPWVSEANVRKQWPDTVLVHVQMRKPFAYWGRDQLVSDQGVVFPRAGVRALPANMPRLDGDVRNVGEVLALYARAQDLFGAVGARVTALARDARGSWTLELADGTQVTVGRTDAQARLARFARLMPRLMSERRARILHADLRYTNGFALRWQGQGAPSDAPADVPVPQPRAPTPAALPKPIALAAPPRTAAPLFSITHT